MPEMLTIMDVDELVARIHAAQREQREAMVEREADAEVQARGHDVVAARLALERAEKARDEAGRKYDERAQLAADQEAELRDRLAKGWPAGVKTVGFASMTARRTVQRKASVPPIVLVSQLQSILGASGALPKIVTEVKLDAKALLPLVDAMPALGEVLDVVEMQTLTIRQPKEEEA